VRLVQGLGQLQHLGGGEAEAAVRVALQVGQVVQRRRAVVADLLLDRRHRAGSMRLDGLVDGALQPLGLLLLVDAGLAVLGS
jgi:hypothetical protein